MRIRCRQPPKGEQLTYGNNGRPCTGQFAMWSLGGVALTNILAHQVKIGCCTYCYYRFHFLRLFTPISSLLAQSLQQLNNNDNNNNYFVRIGYISMYFILYTIKTNIYILHTNVVLYTFC